MKPEKDVLDSILKNERMTKEQKRAVAAIDGDLLITACAGAGKTRVVTLRIIHLLAAGVRPENIVAITFTRKAAAELKSRIYDYGKKYLGSTRGFADMFVGTIDSFCFRMLQEYDEEFLKYSVLGETQANIFASRHRAELGKGMDIHRLRAMTALLNENWFDKEYRTKWKGTPLTLLETYNRLLLENKRLDYTLVLRQMLERLDPDSDTNGGTMSSLGREVFRRVKYLTLDEYQDTSPAQEHLVSLLKKYGKTNLCVVGDADQTIYQFRGSEEQNILGFAEKYNIPPENRVSLIRDFRSTSGVVDVAAKVIAKGHENEAGRKPMEAMENGTDRTWEPGDTTFRRFEKPEEEYDFIAERIRALHALGVPYAEMAILLRQRQSFREKFAKNIAAALQRGGIPYIIEGVAGLFDTPEGKAATGIFAYLYEKHCKRQKDPDTGKYLYGFQTAEQDAEARETLVRLWDSVGFPFQPEELQGAVDGLAGLNFDGLRYGNELNLQEIYQAFLEHLSILSSDSPEAEHILYNLGKVSQVIDDYESIVFREHPMKKLSGLYHYLDETARSIYPEGEEDNAFLRGDAVNILTIHQSKGLEFTVVFLPCLAQSVFPWDTDSLQKLPKVFKTVPPEWIRNAQRYKGSLAAERKLFYVAVTRAKKYLFLTRAETYRNVPMKASCFWDDAQSSSFLTPFDPDTVCTKDHLPSFEPSTPPIALNFSILANYFDCPYRFKLASFYGFRQPIHMEEGYGTMLHEIIMRIHKCWLAGTEPDDDMIRSIVENASYLPYAPEYHLDKVKDRALRAARNYVRENEADAHRILKAEANIELALGQGISVNGRIDLVRTVEADGGESVAVVDLKTGSKDSAECLNAEQLKIYALGYEELTGTPADIVEIYHLDQSQVVKEPVTRDLLDTTKRHVIDAANAIRGNRLPRNQDPALCAECRMRRLCGKKA